MLNEAFRLGGPGSKTFVTRRGHILVVTSELQPRPILTVELAAKWYELHVVHASGVVEPRPFADLGPGGWIDHVPIPAAVERLAAREGWFVDEVALELITGRWELEIVQS
jgi:hypothetical protein